MTVAINCSKNLDGSCAKLVAENGDALLFNINHPISAIFEKAQNADKIIIATPIIFGSVAPFLLELLYSCQQYFTDFNFLPKIGKEKKGEIILTAGGSHSDIREAERLCRIFLKIFNCSEIKTKTDLATDAVKLGLERIKELLDRLHNPQKGLKIVHIIGTNGKGSTVHYLTNGYKDVGRAGSYTSPEIECSTENIKINGEKIDKAEFEGLLKKINLECESMLDKPTKFEIQTALALLYFSRQNVDIVFFEAGLGGLGDATSVVEPVLTLVTSISVDHQSELGQSLEQIAKSESGAFKRGVPIISITGPSEVREILEKKATELGAKISFVSPEKLKTYQGANVALARAGLEFLGIKSTIDPNDMPKGRLEVVAGNPTILLDAAHNEAGASALVASIKNLYDPKKAVFIINFYKDKDIEAILGELKKISQSAVILQINDNPRIVDEKVLTKLASKHFKNINTAKNALDALKIAKKQKPDIIVICGTIAILRHMGTSI